MTLLPFCMHEAGKRHHRTCWGLAVTFLVIAAFLVPIFLGALLSNLDHLAV